MNEPRQKIMFTLGEAGCYFLSLVHIAEDLHGGRRIDAVQMFLSAVQLGLCRDDCFIVDPGGIMQLLYGGRWTWRKEAANYAVTDGEFEVLRFERPTPGFVYSHFVLGDGTGHVKYDPLGDSKTVAGGTLISKRILKMVIGES